MIHVAPTILTSDALVFKKQMDTFMQFAKRIQIDFVDGDFAPVRTLPLIDIPTLPKSDIHWDIHLMASQPSAHIEQVLRLSPALCIFPAEIDEKLIPLFDQLKSHNIKAGVALLKGTFPGDLTNVIKAADHVLIFAGDLGRQGGKADMLQTEKVAIIKNINPTVEIGWDGGANMKTIRAIAHSGVNVINVGSAISSAEDPAKAYKELNTESDRHGVLLQ